MEELANGSLKILRAPDLSLTRRIGIFYRRDIKLAPAAQTLLERIKAAATKHRHLPRRR